MNAEPRSARHELSVRLAAFAALAVFAAWHWARMVADPPVGRVALAVAALAAGAALLALISSLELGRVRAWALAAVGIVAATAVGVVTIGVPAGLLAPEAWDRLGDELGRGFTDLDSDVEYPYGGDNEWSRRVLLAGLPLALGLAAALSFWPYRRATRGTKALGLAALIATYAIAAAAVPPGEPLLAGLVLLFLIAAWLWLPRLGPRDAIAGGALIAVAGLVGLAAAGRLDAGEPLIDYRNWDLARSEADEARFDWDHSYGPLDWPRDGETLFGVKSDEPHYWKASVLEAFDGIRWKRPAYSAGERLEAPPQVEGTSGVVELDELNPEWIEIVGVTLGPIGSDLVISPGTVVEVRGVEGILSPPDGTTVMKDEPLADGDSYSVTAYVPDPSEERIRAAPRRYPAVLARYTEVGLSLSAGNESSTTLIEEVDVPLRSGDGTGRLAARRELLDSPYAETYRLAHRLTAGQPTAYDAVTAVQDHLRNGDFAYTEAVPPTGKYPLATFLSESRRGYCQQFSGAMALMLRMVGIPSRVATGFTAGSDDPDAENRYLVTDFDAHSWVEVYFTGIGWVAFDPTPAASPASSQLGEGELAGTAGGLGIGSDRPVPSRRRASDPIPSAPSSDGNGVWMVLPAGIVLLGLVAGVRPAVRARRYRSLSPTAAADAQLRELDAGLARLGSPVLPGETLLALEHRLRMHHRPATARYVRKLRCGRFERGDPAAPIPAERRAARRELSSHRGPWGRLRGVLAIPLGGPSRSRLHARPPHRPETGDEFPASRRSTWRLL